MMETGQEIPATPDLETLLQAEPAAPFTVPVRFDGPQEVRQLPNRRSQNDTTAVTFTNTPWVPVLPNQPKRATGVLIAAGGGMRISTKNTGGGTEWPAGVPFPIAHTQPVFVQAMTVDITVGHAVELWAD